MNRTDQTHSFDTGVARVVGTDRAVLLKEISGWCEMNRRRGINYHDGEFWTFNPASAYADKFDYMNIKSVSRWLKQMSDQYILYVGNYNQRKADRTLWHRVNPVFYMLASTRRISSVDEWLEGWDEDSGRWCPPQNEATNSQNEVTNSQNEVTNSQNEVTLPPLTNNSYTPKTNSDRIVDVVDGQVDQSVTLFDNSTAPGKKSSAKKSKSAAEFRIAADAVLTELVTLTGKKYATGDQRGADGNRRLVVALMRKGYTAAELTTMVQFKVWRWSGGRMEEYLRPSTLFGKEKSPGYIEEARLAVDDPAFAAKVREWKAAEQQRSGGAIALTQKTTDAVDRLVSKW